MHNQKSYTVPELWIYGEIEDITLQGGGSSLDVPIGTPTNNINDVTS